MFSDEFKARLQVGKNTQWEKVSSDTNVHALLWLVGAFACRACEMIPLLEEHERRLPEFDVAFTRALTGLKGIQAI